MLRTWPPRRQHKKGARTIIKKIDTTIETLCDMVQKEAKESDYINEKMPDMIKALAELISARAEIEVI